MSRMKLTITDASTKSLVKSILGRLPVEERRRIASCVAAVAEGTSSTGIIPFTFQGILAQELTFDPRILRLLGERRAAGAVAAAFAIASLHAERGREFPLSNEGLLIRDRAIVIRAGLWGLGEEAKSFLFGVMIATSGREQSEP